MLEEQKGCCVTGHPQMRLFLSKNAFTMLSGKKRACYLGIELCSCDSFPSC